MGMIERKGVTRASRYKPTSLVHHTGVPSQRTRFFMGVDLGQTNDPTAVAIVRREDRWDNDGRLVPVSFQVPYLERLPLGTSYPAQVAHVGELLRREPLSEHETTLTIDHTGVGRPVFDLFTKSGLKPRGLIITGGHESKRTGTGWTVSKLQLVSRLQAELHENRLRVSSKLKDMPALMRELQDFRVNISTAGNAIFAARVGAHDDLVLALAIAVWEATAQSGRVSVTKLKGF